jgi:hypothetical protein
MLLPMHPEATTRLRVTTLHTKGSVLLFYGPSYILIHSKVHSEIGHFGIKRIYSLLALHYHW